MAATDGADTLPVVAPGDFVEIETVDYSWAHPMEVTDVDFAEQRIDIRGPDGAAYSTTPTRTGGGISLRGKDGRHAGIVLSIERADELEDDSNDPDPEAVWERFRERDGVSQFVSLEDFLDAVQDADSLFHASKSARVTRRIASAGVSNLGLCRGRGSARTFPPVDLDERVEMVRNGELPKIARARDWDWGESDD